MREILFKAKRTDNGTGMREILCKAKRTDNGEWVEGYYFKFIDKSYIADMERTFMEAFYTEKSVVDFHMRAYEVEADTVCRYTGLRDYNVDKMWENDVIQDCDGDFGIVKYGTDNRAVFTICYKNKTDWILLDRKSIRLLEIKVIGNTFDNSELVERN